MIHKNYNCKELILEGALQEAIQILQERIARHSLFPVYEDYFLLSLVYCRQGDTKNQERIYQKVYQLRQKLITDVHYYEDYASLLLSQQRFQEALSIIREGIHQHPVFAEELFYLEAFIWYYEDDLPHEENYWRAFKVIEQSIGLSIQNNEYVSRIQTFILTLSLKYFR